MKKIVLLGLIIFFTLINVVSANDKYITYTQTFPWIGPEGEDPEVVFADLIEKHREFYVYEKMSFGVHEHYEPILGFEIGGFSFFLFKNI